MKIEAGKFYKTRDGRKVGPMVNEGWIDGEPWTAEDINRYYTDEGSRIIPTGEPDDLIAEWSDLTPHQQRTAEMIKVMQAYVDGDEVQGNACGTFVVAAAPVWNWAQYDYRVAPATTPDTIDWSHVAPEFKWMARDSNGIGYLYKEKPYLCDDYWDNDYTTARTVHFSSYRPGTCYWKDSLVKRTE